MRKFLMFVLSIMIVVATSSVVLYVVTTISTFQKSANISTWLWDTSEIVSKPDSVIKELVDNNVKVLFLQVNNKINIKYYKSFISKASANQISVYALDGSPDWVSSTGSSLQQAYISWLTNYQKLALRNEKFKGMHLDVEPNENDQYAPNTNSVLDKYQEFIIKFNTQASNLKLDFSIDIPFWFYGVNYNTKYGKGNVAEWLCKNVKSITIMAYRDTASGYNGIIRISAAEMKLFNKYNIKGIIAVETGKLDDSNNSVTFYGEGRAYMYQQLDLVYQSYKNDPAFNGIAIHCFDSWMSMAN